MAFKKAFPKLGCLRSPHDHRTLRFEAYLKAQRTLLPKARPKVDWFKAVKKPGMMANDRCGDCVLVTEAHMIQTCSANESKEIVIPDDVVLGAYARVTGFDPKTGANDNGTIPLEALKDWQKNGIDGAGTHKCGPYASIDITNRDHMRLAMDLLGGIFLAAALPLSAQGASSWKTPPKFRLFKGDWVKGSWGGHAIMAAKYSDDKGFWVFTWGTFLFVEWGWWDAYGLEAWAVMVPEWNSDGETPSGLNADQWNADYRALTGN